MKRRIVNIGGENVEIPAFDNRLIIYIVIGIAVLWFIFSAAYTVNTDEVGVIQRFGAYVRTTQPGLHFKLPWGIETAKKVKTQRVFKQEFGFRTAKAGIKTEYVRGNFESESLMLTGDLNSALVEWIVQYRIQDPVDYLFKVRDVESTIRYVSEAAMRQVVGDNSVDEVIILRRKDIALEVAKLMQGLLDEYETGVNIVTVNLQDVNPPVPVQAAFNEVNEAKQEKEKIINQAWEAYNNAIPKAKGQAEQAILEAEGYATNRVNRSQGDADKFLAVLREYSKAKDVTKRRLYLEMMNDVLPKINSKVIIDDKVRSFLPLLQLNGKEVGK